MYERVGFHHESSGDEVRLVGQGRGGFAGLDWIVQPATQWRPLAGSVAPGRRASRCERFCPMGSATRLIDSFRYCRQEYAIVLA